MVVRRSNAGYIALIAVLIIGAAALAIGVLLLWTGTDSQRASLVELKAQQARGLAVACAEEALEQIHDNTAYTGSSNLTQGQGTCTYTVTNTGASTRAVYATGTVGVVVRKVQVAVTVGASALSITSWQEVNALTNPSTPAFVQQAAAIPSGSFTSVAQAYPSAETAGNTNVVIIGWSDTTASISSVTDTAGNSYQLAVPIFRGTGVSQAIYYAKNISGGSSTVTVTFSSAATSPDLRILEYSGLDRYSPLDTSASANGTGGTASSGSFTTSYPTELIVGGGTTLGGFSGAGAGFTSRVITGDGNIAEDRVVTTAGSYSATGPTSGNWVMQGVGFRAAGQ